uniref:HTH domain-containing protein n=1 Tax=Bifidobacterium biavatii TaxID=762212 RepID=UPI0019D3F79C
SVATITRTRHKSRQGWGGVAAVAKKRFTREQVRHLATLPAVVHVTENRITYSTRFKQACIVAMNDGESPMRVFERYGLTPDIIGRKRIERCANRWRGEADSILGLTTAEDDPLPSPTQLDDNANMHDPAIRPGDLRDQIIAQQSNYISMLERELASLRQENERLASAASNRPTEASCTIDE